MENIGEFIPFLIPLAVAQIALLAWALYHILTHDTYRRGTRTLWVVVTLVFSGFVGPILYFIFGREDA